MFIRTLKGNLLWIRRFNAIGDVRQALLRLKDTYNRTWIVDRDGSKRPLQVPQSLLGVMAAAAEEH